MRRRLLLPLIAALLTSACAVPYASSDRPVEKVAIDENGLDRVIERYDAVRQTALRLLNPQPLGSVQRGPLLQIDTGRIEVAQTLSTDAVESIDDAGRLEVESLYAPIVDAYPMWFMVVARDTAEENVRVQIFQREAAADAWVLVASPEILETTRLPELRAGREDSLVVLDPEEDSGLVASPVEVAETYRAALDDPESDAVAQITTDGFWSQMRDARIAAAEIPGIDYAARWDVVDADYAVRTDDGGALMFATFQRHDTYASEAGSVIGWPPGSPEEAFLSDGLSGEGSLQYMYQVLLYVPPAGEGTPYAMGHYGGVVSADDEPDIEPDIEPEEE